MRTFSSVTVVIVLSCVLSACGGGGGGSTTGGGGGGGGGGGNPTPPTVLTGVFIDSPVVGLDYATSTQSGTTDAEGTFRYLAGEVVTFSIGSIVIGSAMGAEQITPFSLFELTPPTNQNQIDLLLNDGVAGDFDRAINIASLLVALDADDNPDNGIDLAGRGTLLATASLDFNVDNAIFRSTNFPSFLTTHSITGTSWQSVITHLYSSLDIDIINALPSFTSGTSGTALENATVTSYAATATDADSPNLTFSLSGGADAALFSINSATGVLGFVAAPDFESPLDADTNNIYEILIQVSDGSGGTAEANLSIQVLGVNEPPSITSAESAEIPENSISTGLIVTAFDPEGDIPGFDIVGGVDQSLFSINGSTGELSFIAAPDFEYPDDAGANNFYEVTVLVTDITGETNEQDVQIAVQDVTQLSLYVSYPTPNASLGGVSQTVVTGYVTDEEDNEVLSGDIDTLFVNGVLANFDIQQTSRWQAEVTVDSTPDSIEITANLSDTSGNFVQVVQPIHNNLLFNLPYAVAIDELNNIALITDLERQAIFAVDLAKGSHRLVSDENTGEGPNFQQPFNIAVDTESNQAYVIDWGQPAPSLLSLNLESGDRTVISDSLIGEGPSLDSPWGIIFDPTNDRVLVSEDTLGLVSIDISSGDRTVLSGSGIGTGPNFNSPSGIVLDSSNNRVLLADRNGSGFLVLFDINLNTGNRTIISEPYVSEGFDEVLPFEIALDSDNNRVLISDEQIKSIVAVNLTTGERTVMSDSTTGNGTNFGHPRGIEIDTATNRTLVVDDQLQLLMAVDLDSGNRSTISNGAAGLGTNFHYPVGIALAPLENRLLVTDAEFYGRLSAIDLDTSDRSVIADIWHGEGVDLRYPVGVDIDNDNNRALVGLNYGDNSALIAIDLETGDRTVVSNSDIGEGEMFSDPKGISFDSINNRVLIVSNAKLFEVNLETGNRSILSGPANGAGTNLSNSQAIALDLTNNRALIADYLKIISVDLDTGNRTVISDNVTGSGVSLGLPVGIAFDSANNRALVADFNMKALLAIDLDTGDRTVISDNSTMSAINFSQLQMLAYDPINNLVFIIEQDLAAVVVIDLATGERAVSSK